MLETYIITSVSVRLLIVTSCLIGSQVVKVIEKILAFNRIFTVLRIADTLS